MPLSSCQFTWLGVANLAFCLQAWPLCLLCSGNPDDTPANEILPSDFGCFFQTNRNSFPAVAKLVASSHWGPFLPPQWEDLARTEAPIDESRTRSSRKIPYDTESDITLGSSIDGNKFPFFLNHIESVIVTKQFQPLSVFSLSNHHLAHV